MAIPIGATWHLIKFLVCISLMIIDVEHVFMSLLVHPLYPATVLRLGAP